MRSQEDEQLDPVDPRDPATYCKLDGHLYKVGEKRCDPVTQKVHICRGNDAWDRTEEDCTPVS